MTSRSYCITFWSEPKPVDDTKIRYAIYGKEICPDTKKVHWQSYVEFNTSLRMAAVKKLYNDETCHIEKRMGTREQARDYCAKDKDFTEHGKWIKGQGHRSDLDDIVDRMLEGELISNIKLEEGNRQTYCKYNRGLESIQATITKKLTKPRRQVEVEIITGPPRIGKTEKAMTENPDAFKIVGRGLDWFCGYEQEKTLVIDEYNNDAPITYMLNLLDSWQLRLPVKGSHTWANWTKVVITTNLTLKDLHANARAVHREALFGRVTKITNLWPTEKQPKRVLEDADDEIE